MTFNMELSMYRYRYNIEKFGHKEQPDIKEFILHLTLCEQTQLNCVIPINHI